MADRKEPGDQPIGYGVPPQHSQYQPGQSGNPGGRPKGAKSLKSVLQDELAREINLSEQGVHSKVTKMEALAKRLVGDALSGKARSLSELLRQIKMHLPDSEGTEKQDLPASEGDVRLLLKYASKAVDAQLSGEQNNDTSDEF
ncbi:MAG: hypothetical protein COB40_04055 [Marinosulfonomonas sp.]|nr:hypothetical protein [Methylophaga sp.]PHQ97642.1 MAG: hypothetical protein COB40_04055 [Marinosulfonomonas sp.]